MHVELVRYSYGPADTLGRMRIGDVVIHTLERPWIPDPLHGSLPSLSCVPDGEYRLVPHSTERFPDTWALVNEDLQVTHHQAGPGRFAILFHAANTVDEIEGCIAPGMRSGIRDGRQMVLDSRQAMERFRDHLVAGEHTLNIRPTEGAVHPSRAPE